MDREPDTRGCRGAGHRLRGAPGRICAGVSRSTGVRRPTDLPASRSASDRSCTSGADGELAGSGCGSRASASAAASSGRPASADRRCDTLGSSGGSGRSHSGRSGPLLRLDSRLLFLERRLDLDRRPLRCSAQAHRRLGGWPLDAARPRLCMDRRRLAVAGSGHHTARLTSGVAADQCGPGEIGACGAGWAILLATRLVDRSRVVFRGENSFRPLASGSPSARGS